MLESTAGLGLFGLWVQPGQFPTHLDHPDGDFRVFEDRESICEDDHTGLGLGWVVSDLNCSFFESFSFCFKVGWTFFWGYGGVCLSIIVPGVCPAMPPPPPHPPEPLPLPNLRWLLQQNRLCRHGPTDLLGTWCWHTPASVTSSLAQVDSLCLRPLAL